MRKLFIRYPVPRPLSLSLKVSRLVKGALLAPCYFLLAMRFRVPGLQLRLQCAAVALRLFLTRRGRVSAAAIFVTLFWPMDSTRYFEFDFIWRRMMRRQPRDYLDVSSPRLFPLMLVRKQPLVSAHFVNPDLQDLEETKRYAAALKLAPRCAFEPSVINAVPYADRSFDLITCISVLEHIPDNIAAVSKMWNLLKPGGRLFITVPCLATAAEQYVNVNLYGLAVPKEEDYSFLQYYYDDSLLRQFIFPITGEPVHFSIYGEMVEGSFRRYVDRAIAEPFKDRWKDPYRMGKEFKYYDSISELPGEGVIAMEFVRQ